MSAVSIRIPTLPYRRGSLLLSIGGLAVTTTAGLAVGTGHTVVAIVLAIATIALLAPSLSLTHWASLLLLSAVMSRAFVELFDLPTLANFLHYPVTIAFAMSACLRPGETSEASRRLGRWILGLLVLAGASMLGNGSHPLRAAIFLTIVSQPLIVIWAIVRWEPAISSTKKVFTLAAITLGLQLPIALWQGLQNGLLDHIQGTYIGSGNGAHLLGALFALGMLVICAAVLAGRLRTSLGVVAIGVALVIIVACGANQVLLSGTLALLCTPFVAFRFSSRGPARAVALLVGGCLSVILVAVSAMVLMQHAQPSNILERSRDLFRPSQLPEVQLIRQRLAADPAELLVGSGPGTTASRASVLLTPTMMKQSSPLAALHLPPTEAGLRLVGETRSRWGGSAESFTSGVLGITGDLGLIGLAGLAAVLVGVWRMLRRVGGWLAPVRVVVIMTAALLPIDNWLEYPEYTVPLALLLGFALRSSTDDRLPVPNTIDHSCKVGLH